MIVPVLLAFLVQGDVLSIRELGSAKDSRSAPTSAEVPLLSGGAASRPALAIQAAIEAGDLAAASKLVREALAHSPRDGGLFNLRGIIHAKQNEMALARKDFGSAVRLAPSLTPAWQNLARACQQLNELPCATEAWERVLRASRRLRCERIQSRRRSTSWRLP